MNGLLTIPAAAKPELFAMGINHYVVDWMLIRRILFHALECSQMLMYLAFAACAWSWRKRK